MSATEVMEEINKLPPEEQKKLFVFLTEKVMASHGPIATPWLGKKLSFEEACDVVFSENRQLLSLLAK
jgi:hypothetical protein